MSIYGFDKRKDMKSIVEVNQDIKKIFTKALVLDKGWVIGDNTVGIGMHFSRILNTDNGICKFKETGKILSVDTQELFTSITGNKKAIADIEIEDNKINFMCDEIDNIRIGTLEDTLDDDYKPTLEVLLNTIKDIDNPIQLSDSTIKSINKNNHFIVIPTQIEEVRISKQLLPVLRYTTKQVSDVFVYTLPSENEYMYKVVFKVVNEYVEHYHVYMAIKKGEE